MDHPRKTKMQLKNLILVAAMMAVISSCSSVTFSVPAPAEPVGASPETDWSPYAGPAYYPPAPRAAKVSPVVPTPVSPPIVKQDLTPLAETPSAPSDETSAVPQTPASTDQPRPYAAPTSDVAMTPRYYSSRPGKYSVSTTSKPSAATVASSVKSEWADEHVPASDRSGFDKAAGMYSTRGEGRFTGGDSKVYLMRFSERSGDCSTVEVRSTADGGLPILSRGLVYVCG